jgi:hypothetical protein
MAVDYHEFAYLDMPKEERKKFGIGDIYNNMIQCLECKYYVRSRNRLDYRECNCGKVAVDGGSWYLRRTGDLKLMRELSITFKDVEKDV